MSMEEWKDIKGYDGYYQVSNLGRVRSLYFDKIRIIKQRTDKYGYKQVNLSKDGKYKNYLVHRLVAVAFIPNPNNYPIINHKDENPSNNEVSNLEWCTQKYNVNYGTAQKRRSEKLIGKIRKLISKPVLQFTKKGEFVAEYPSMMEAASQTGVEQGDISRCCNGKRNSAGGFIWRHKK